MREKWTGYHAWKALIISNNYLTGMQPTILHGPICYVWQGIKSTQSDSTFLVITVITAQYSESEVLCAYMHVFDHTTTNPMESG